VILSSVFGDRGGERSYLTIALPSGFGTFLGVDILAISNSVLPKFRLRLCFLGEIEEAFRWKVSANISF
jgi:hypothetical protein